MLNTKPTKCLSVFICITFLLTTLISPPVIEAQDKKPLSWANVLKLRNGDRINVTLFSNDVHTGKTQRVDQNALELLTPSGSLLIPKENIKSIWHVRRPKLASPGGYAMLGGGALLVGTLVAGTAKDVSDVRSGTLTSSTGRRYGALSVAGALIAAGGIVTLVLGAKPKLIYESQTTLPNR